MFVVNVWVVVDVIVGVFVGGVNGIMLVKVIVYDLLLDSYSEFWFKNVDVICFVWL